MTQYKTLESHGDAVILLDKALEVEGGIEIKLSSNGEAIRTRFRLYQARNRDRAQILKTKPEDPPPSPYDSLAFIIEGVTLRIIPSEDLLKGLEIRSARTGEKI